MRVKIIGDNDCARATKGLLRQAGFAVSEFLPEIAVSGYTVTIEIGHSGIYLDSIESPIENAFLRHLTQLWDQPVVLDRKGGRVHGDRELRVVVQNTAQAQHAVELSVVRAMLDMQNVATGDRTAPRRKKILGLFVLLFVLTVLSSAAIVVRAGPEYDQSLAIAPEKVPPVSVDLPLDASDRMSIRDLQVQQDTLIIKRDQLDVQRLELTAKIRDLDDQMKTIAFNSAQANGIDVKKYLIDFDKLVWVLTASEKKP